LLKIRQSYAEISGTQRHLLMEREKTEAVAEEWYRRAQFALQRGNEDLAKNALSKRQQASEKVAALIQQMDTQTPAMEKLYEGMQALEAKILEAKFKKDQLVARARTAQSTQKVSDMLSGITGKTSMDAFTRMEDKIFALESAAEVTSSNQNLLPGSGPFLENEFKALEAESSVEEEFKKLKGLLNPCSSPPNPTKNQTAIDEGLPVRSSYLRDLEFSR
jgi:phage shock protein A